MMQLMRAGRLAANEILQAAASWDRAGRDVTLPASDADRQCSRRVHVVPGCCSQFGLGRIEGVHVAALNTSHRIDDAVDEGGAPGGK